MPNIQNANANLLVCWQEWKTEDGKLEKAKDFTDRDFLEETNASGQTGMFQVLKHVEEKYKELRNKQKKLTVELNVEQEGQFASALINKFIK